jgi:cation/acetate symporter
MFYALRLSELRMQEVPTTFDWGALLRLIGLWMVVVFVALRALDLLFPRLRRGEDDAPPRQGPPLRRATGLRPSAGQPTLPWGAQRLAEGRAPSVGLGHWDANVRMIVVLLLIWIGAAFVPAVFAPQLNQVTLLTGFPLGYYMGSQGSLIVFLGLITAYAWRAGRIDRRFSLAILPGSAREGRAATWRLGMIYILFSIVFVLLTLTMGELEQRIGLPANVLGWALMIVTIGIYTVIGLTARARTLDEYFVAGRRVPAFFNGMAIGADWMSAASFISMAGTLWLLGYEGLAYIMGWTGGYVLLALLLAPYLRKFGQYTIPDFVAARYEGNRARVVAAIMGVIISFTYVTAQVAGTGYIMNRFLGVNYLAGVAIGLGAVLFCSYLGGMRAITWTQVAQCIVLLIAYLAPVTMLSLKLTGVPFPQIMYGEALQQITRLEAAQGITKSYVTPFNDWTPWNFLALMLCLMAGTAGLPHILIRFYSVPDVGAARRSVGWALLFICLLYFTAPAYAAFSRWEILQNVVGKPITAVPEWATNWSNAGLLAIKDLNADGILQFDELKINPALVVLATPEIAGLPHTIAALVAAGGLAAALSTADGLLMVIASALAHDVYARAINPGASARERLLVGRALILLAAAAAALTATRQLPIIVQLVAWAFSFAAATFFPILVLGIFWKRANGNGAVAGMIAGLIAALAYMLLNAWKPDFNILGITNVAAGIFGVPVNFLVTYSVSKLTAPPPLEIQKLVDSLRQP